MLTRSEDFVEPDLAAMEAERRERKIKHLLRQASLQSGFDAGRTNRLKEAVPSKRLAAFSFNLSYSTQYVVRPPTG